MDKLEPVAEIENESVRWLPESRRILEGTKLYAINTDTHRVVSLKLLRGMETALKLLIDNDVTPRQDT